MQHGSPDSRPAKVDNGRLSAFLNLFRLKNFRVHPLLKPYNLCYSRPNGVAILSSFHDIPKNISVRYRPTDAIN